MEPQPCLAYVFREVLPLPSNLELMIGAKFGTHNDQPIHLEIAMTDTTTIKPQPEVSFSAISLP